MAATATVLTGVREFYWAELNELLKKCYGTNTLEMKCEHTPETKPCDTLPSEYLRQLRAQSRYRCSLPTIVEE